MPWGQETQEPLLGRGGDGFLLKMEIDGEKTVENASCDRQRLLRNQNSHKATGSVLRSS